MAGSPNLLPEKHPPNPRETLLYWLPEGRGVGESLGASPVRKEADWPHGRGSRGQIPRRGDSGMERGSQFQEKAAGAQGLCETDDGSVPLETLILARNDSYLFLSLFFP